VLCPFWSWAIARHNQPQFWASMLCSKPLGAGYESANKGINSRRVPVDRCWGTQAFPQPFKPALRLCKSLCSSLSSAGGLTGAFNQNCRLKERPSADTSVVGFVGRITPDQSVSM
jgi:hypothetical protein